MLSDVEGTRQKKIQHYNFKTSKKHKALVTQQKHNEHHDMNVTSQNTRQQSINDL